MIRVLGAVMVLLGATWIGIRKTLCYLSQISQLKTLSTSMEMLQCELNYTMYSVPKILDLISERSKAPWDHYFSQLSGEIGKGTPRELAARRSLEACPKLNLPGDALLALLEFSTALGSYDLDGENRICKLSSLRVSQSLERLEREKGPLVKSYIALGASTGIALIILML